MVSTRRPVFGFALSFFVLLLTYPVLGRAATADFKVYLNVDHDSTTGCRAAVATGSFAGVEQILTTTVDLTTHNVVSVSRQQCTDPATSAFSAPIAVDAGGWSTEPNANGGQYTVETHIPVSVLGGGSMPFDMHLGFSANAGSLADVVDSAGSGPIVFPHAASHRRAVSIAPARVFVYDGKRDDWSGIAPLVPGSTGSGSSALRFTDIYAYTTQNDVVFLFGVQAEPGAPTAVGDAYTVATGGTLGIATPGVLGNDSDPASKPLTAIQVTAPHSGTLTLNPNGSFTYTHDGGPSASDNFDYKANNGTLDSNIAHVQITVSNGSPGGPPATPPVASDDSYSIGHNGTLIVSAPGVRTNDNPNGNPSLTVVLGSGPAHGTLTLHADGSFIYDHDGSNTLSDSFTYTLQFGAVISNVATVHITVGADQPVHAVNDSFTVAEGGTLNITAPGLLGNDSDPDTPISGWSASVVSSPTNGSVILNPNGSFVYTHNGSETTSDSFTYRVSDGIANSNVATVNITVTPVNDPPVANNDGPYATLEDQALTVPAPGVLANDTDADTPHASLTSISATTPLHGTVALNPDGSFLYTPQANYNGTDTFTYRAFDGLAQSLVAGIVTINLTPVNDAPSFNAGGVVTVPEDSGAYSATWATNVLAGPSDEVGQSLNFNIVNNSNPSLFTVAPAISAAGVLTFTPAPNANGTALITLNLHDTGGVANGGVDTSANVVLTINVTPINDAPVLTAGGTLAYTENAAATAIDTTITVVDIDSANLASATAQVTGNYVNGEDVLSFTNTATITGSFNAATGTLTLTGSDTVANYQAALRAVRYANTSDNPSTLTRTITWVANDGSNSSAPVTSSINVTAVNDAPVVTPAGNLTYTENQAATAIDPAIAVSDVDNANLASATVQITANYVNGQDVLSFTNTASITGSFNAATGTLTLTGSTTVANWQTALRNVRYANLSDNPSTAVRSVTWIVNDGSTTSSPATNSITVVSVDDAPVVVAGSGVTFTENGAPVAVDATLTVTDVDSATLASATVQISGNYAAGEDSLALPAPVGAITGVWNAGSGTLTLSGVDTLANYQTALRSVTYSNSSDAPSTLTRTLTYVANDGTLSSAAVTSTVDVTPVNDAPVLTAGATLAFTENQGPTAIDGTVAITDVDSTTLASATVQITANYVNGEDLLAFTNTATISGSFNAATGTLTLTGTDSIANYQAALRSVTYDDVAENPSAAPRTITWQVNDGGAANAASNTATSTVNITPVNDAPVLAGASNINYTENSGAVALVPAATVSDVDSTTLTGATVSISGNFVSSEDVLALPAPVGTITGSYNAGTGVLTLTGTDTLANYQTALRSVTYTNTSDNPSTAARGIDIVATDGTTPSAALSLQVNIIAVNDAPVVTAGATLAFTENQGATVLDGGLTVTDVDSAMLTGATVSITGNFVSTEDVLAFAGLGAITGSYNAGTGVMTLTGTDTVANYQAALRLVTYNNTSEDPSTAARTITWVVTDGAASSSAVTSSVTVTAVNDAPTVTPSTNLAYTEGTGAVVIDAGVTVSDPDSTSLSSATVQITGNYVAGQDILGFTNTASITGSFNAVTGTMTLSGTDTIANYVAALRSVTYMNTSNAPSAALRTVTWNATDTSAGTGAGLTSTITVTSVNTPPAVVTSNSPSYTENAAALTLEPSLSVTDPDSATLSGATVSITANFNTSEDVLAVTGNGTISGSYNAATGVLTLTGVDTVANYQSVLRTVTYANTSDNPSTATRTVTWVVSDGTDSSSPATTSLAVVAVNDAPIVTPATTLGFTENQGATVVSSGLTITDADNTTLTGATVQITANYANGQDVLAMTNVGAITGSFNAATGTLTLTGTDSIANYQAALRTVTYDNLSDNPSTAARTITWTATDGTTPGSATTTVNITAVNDAPVLTINTATLNYTENQGATVIDGALTVTDADSTNLASAAVAFTAGYQNGADSLGFINTATITGSFNAATGTLTLTGSDTVANYQTALRSILYRNTSDTPTTAARTLQWSVNDGTAASNLPTSTINMTAVNDAPVVTAPAAATTAEDTTFTFNGGNTISIADVDAAGGDETVTVTSTNGIFTLGGTAGLTSVSGNGTGVVQLTGTIANLNLALAGSTFTPSANFNGAGAQVQVSVNDQGNSGGAAQIDTKNVIFTVTAVNDAPVLANAGSTITYTEANAATVIESGISASDIDSVNFNSATVSITAGFQNGADVLAATTAGTSIVANYTAGTGVLSLTGNDTVAHYQQVLRTVTYLNTSNAPSTTQRQISWVVNDGALASNVVTSAVNVISVNDAPVLSGTTTLAYTENQAATSMSSGIVITDPDSTNMGGATIQITANFVSGQDILSFTNTASITGSFNSTSGTMTLTGTDTKANYQTALRNVLYSNTSDAPSVAPRTVTWTVTDGTDTSSPVTSTINVTAVDDSPHVTAGGTLNYTENQGPAQLDNSFTVTDVDSATIAFARVVIVGNAHTDQDVLSFTDTANIHGSWTQATSTLLLTGPDTPAAFAAALKTVTYTNTSDDPSTEQRLVTTQVNDGTSYAPAAAPTTINITAVNDAPTASAPAAIAGFEDQNVVFSGGNAITVADVDAESGIVSVTLTSTNGTLTLGSTAGLNTNSGNGTNNVTISGTIAALNTSLSGTTFTPTLNFNGAATVHVTVTDNGNTGTGGSLSNGAGVTTTLNLAAVNDPPSFTKGPDQITVENAAAVTVNGWASSLSAGPPDEVTAGQTPFSFTVTNNNNAIFSVQPAIAADGTLTFTPAASVTSPNASATVTVTMHDSGGTANGGSDTSGSQTFVIHVDARPTVLTTTPANSATGVATGATITVNFSESVVASTSSFSINCSGTGKAFTIGSSPASSYVLTPTGGLPAGSICTVQVLAANTTDNDYGYNMLSDYTFSFKVPPTAVADTYPQTVIGNVDVNSASIPYSSESNDVSLLPITVTAFDAASANGGTITMGANGQFTYNPPAGYTGSDTFNYTITADDGAGHNAGSATATVTVPVSGVIWFIDRNSAAATADGRITTPFKTIDAFQAINDNAVTAGHARNGGVIFIYESAGAYTGGGINLLLNQKVIGQDSTTTLATHFGGAGFTVPSGSRALPTMNSGNATVVNLTTTTASRNAITLPNNTANTTVIDGLSIGSVTGTGIASNTTGGSSFGTVTIANMFLSTGTGQAINLDTSTTGSVTATIHSIVQSGGAKAVRINNASGTFTVSGDNTAVTPNGGTISNTTGRGMEFIGPAAKNLAVSLTKMNFTNTVSTAVSPSAAGGTCDFVASSGNNSTCAAAIHLQQVTGVTLSTINVTTTKQMGINGYNLANVNMNTVVVTGAGDEANESGLNFQNITGSNTWSGLNIHDNGTTGGQVSVMNDTGTLSSLTITGSTFSRASNGGGNGFAFVGQKTATMNLNVSSSTFTNSSATAMMIHMNENSNGGSPGTPIVVNNCTFTGNNNHIDAATVLGALYVDITNNGTTTPMTGANTGAAINIFGSRQTSGGGTIVTNITNNVIGQTGVANSGCSGACSGIQISSSGSSTVTATVQSNNIRNVSAWGIYAEAFDNNTVGGAKLYTNITNNTIAEPGAFVNEAILVQGGAISTDTTTVCANITGNGVTGTWTGGFMAANIGVWNRYAAGTFRLAGSAGGASAAGTTYLTTSNPSGGSWAASTPAAKAFTGGAPGTCP